MMNSTQVISPLPENLYHKLWALFAQKSLLAKTYADHIYKEVKLKNASSLCLRQRLISVKLDDKGTD